MPSSWSLHPQLAEDTFEVGDLPLSRVLIIKDSNYPWLLLVPRRAGASDLIDLDEKEQAQLTTETHRVSRALREITRPDKLNIAALGNVVAQLHVHIIARRMSDVAWPRPVWGVAPPRPYDPAEAARFAQALRETIGIA